MSTLLPRRRILRALIYIICTILVIDAADLILVQLRRQIHPGFDTTRIVSPTLPDGAVDYLLAIETDRAQGVTPENNAAIPLLLAFGRDALPKNQPTDGITDRIGMPHLPDKGDYYIEYETYCKDHSIPPQDTLYFYPEAHPTWPPSISPEAAQWVGANEKPLALVTQASKRAKCFFPFYGGTRSETMAEILLPHLHYIRDAATALITRAQLRLVAGDTTGCLDDLLTVHRLARLNAQDRTLVGQLVAYGPLEDAVNHVDRMAIASGKLSADQLHSFAQQLQAMGELPSYAVCIDSGERYMTLDLMQSIAVCSPGVRDNLANLLANGGGFDLPNGLNDLEVRFWPIPCEDTMRELNHFYDGLLTAIRQPTYPQRQASLVLWNQQLAQLRQRYWISCLVSPDILVANMMIASFKVEERYTTAKMERRLTLLALTLAAYKLDHGVYPGALNALPCDATDLFTDRPLTYAPGSNGYLLYSAGPNMTDDGGKGDDIAVTVP